MCGVCSVCVCVCVYVCVCVCVCDRERERVSRRKTNGIVGFKEVRCNGVYVKLHN